jgi:hypothetical protein
MAQVVAELTGALIAIFGRYHEINTNPALMSQENVNQITQEIITLSANPYSIAAYIQLIRASEDETLRFYAIINMHSAFRANWVKIEDEAVRTEYLSQIFNLLVTETSQRIIDNLANRVANIVLAHSEYYPMVIQFVRDSHETGAAERINTAINLLSATSKSSTDHKELAEFINTVATTAFGFQNIDLTLAAINMVFKYYVCSQAERNEGIDAIWQQANELLTGLFGDEAHTMQLANIMDEPLALGADFADIEGVLAITLELFNKEECTPDSAKAYMVIIDALCHGYPEFMAGQETLFDIYNRYCLVASSAFEAESHLDDSNFDVFQEIDTCAGANLEFVQHLWESRASFLESAEGQASIFIFIYYSLKDGYDFYEDNLDDLVDLLLEGLSNEVIPVRDAALSAVGEFSRTFSGALQDYVEVLIQPLLESLSEEVTQEDLGIVNCLIENAVDTDPIFDQAIELFFGLFGGVEDTSLRELIIRVIASLAKNSSEKVAEHAEQVYSSVSEIMSADEDSEYYQIRGSAVDVIGSLLQKCPTFFSENAEEIAQFLIQCMQDEDVSLVADALNAYGTMITIMPKSIESSIEAAMEIIPELASKDMSQELVDLTTVLVDTAITGDEDGAGELEADKGIFLDMDRLEIPGAACLLYSTIISNFVGLLPEHIGKIIECISTLCNSVTSISVSFGLRSCVYVFEALQAAESFDTEVLEKLEHIIQSVIETDTSKEMVGEALRCIAALLSCVGLENLGEYPGTIIELLGAVCGLNLQCFDGDKEIPVELYDPLKLLFREIFTAFHEGVPEQVLGIMREIILPMLQKSSEAAFFAMAIIAKWVEFSLPTVPEEALPAILEAAVTVQGKFVGYEGFYLIKILAQKIPAFIAQNVDPILELMKARITQQQKRAEAFIKMMDNLISALGAIAINVMTDSFPEEFYPVALQLMPARIDLSEDTSMFEFFFFIAERFHEADKLAAVLVRLFTMPQEAKYATELTDETLTLLKETLIKLLQSLNADAFITEVCGGDEAKIGHVRQWIQPAAAE